MGLLTIMVDMMSFIFFKLVLPKILIMILIPGVIFIGLSIVSNIIQTGFSYFKTFKTEF